MAFDAGSVIARIKADLTGFKEGIKTAQDSAKTMTEKIKSNIESVNRSIDSMTPALKKIAVSFSALGAGGALIMKDWVSSFSEAQVESQKFNQILKNMGKDGESVKNTLLKVAKSATNLGFDDDKSATQLAVFYQRTKDATKAQYLLSVSQDLARAKSIDLAQATSLVGQVLSGNGKLLKQYDIDIKDTASGMDAVRQVSEKVKGQAAAFMETEAGKALKLSESYGSLKETLGEALIPVLDALRSILQKLVDWFNNLSPVTQKVIAYTALAVTAFFALGGALASLILTIGTLKPAIVAIGTFLAGISVPVWIAIAAVTALGVAFTTNIFGIRDKTYSLFQFLKNIVKDLAEKWDKDFLYIRTIVNFTLFPFYSLIQVFALVAKSSSAMTNAVASQFNSFTSSIASGIISLLSILETFVRSFNSIPGVHIDTSIIDSAKSKITQLSESIKISGSDVADFATKVSGAGGSAYEFLSSGVQKVKGFFNSAKESVTDFATSSIGSFSDMSGGFENTSGTVNKNKQKMIEGLAELKKKVNETLDNLREVHKETVLSLEKDIGSLQNKLSELSASYAKDIGIIQKELKQKLSDIQKDLNEKTLKVRVTLEQDIKQITGDRNRSIAEKFVEEQKNVAELQKKVSEANNYQDKQSLQEELKQKQDALAIDSQYVIGLDAQIAEVKRWNSLTEIQRIFEESNTKISLAKAKADAEIAEAQREYAEKVAIAQRESKESQDRRNQDFLSERAKIQKELGEKKNALAEEEELFHAKEKVIIEIRNQSLKVYAQQIQSMVKFTDDSVNAMISRYNDLNDAIQGVGKSKNLKSLQRSSTIDLGSIGKGPTISTLGDILKNLDTAIPKFATGGIVTGPTLAMIGEAGPEAVVPLSKLGNTGGGWHIHVDGAIIGSVDAAVDLLDMAINRVRPRLGV